MMQGLLDGLSILPTSTWSDGNPVYLGSTAGSITPNKPYAPNHLVYLGFVTTASNGSAGRMYVRVQNGYELDELHNVQAQSPATNDVLYYFGSNQWKTASISTILGSSLNGILYANGSNVTALQKTSSNIQLLGWTTGLGYSFIDYISLPLFNTTDKGLVPAATSGSSTDLFLTSAGTWAKINLSGIANQLSKTILANTTGSTGAVSAVSISSITTDLSTVVGDTGSGGTKGIVPAPSAGDAAAGKFLKADGTWTTPSNQTITLTGDVTGSGTSSFTTTIANSAVTLAKMANLAANSILGNNTGVSATPLALTGTQVTAMLDNFTSTLKGLVPLSGGGTTNFLRADGTWAAPPGGGGGGSYTFSTGLTDTASTITVNLSTGVSGGQSVIGGTASGNSLTLSSTSHATKGTIIFGTSAYDEANNRLGLFTTTPTHKVEVVAGTLTDGQNALNVTATMPTTITSTNTAFDIQITSAGSSAFQNRAVNIDYLAGYTGNGTTSAYNATNSAAGTGTDFFGNRNQGAFCQANAITTGYNVGVYGSASNGDKNAGVVGRSIIAKNSATNIGVLSIALNTGTSPIQVGGFFGLMNSTPTFTSAALMADNGNTTDPIFVGRDNGTVVVQLSDGGFFGIGNGSTAATSQLQVNKNQNSVTQADANGILLANSTAATAGLQSISPAIVLQGNGWKTNAIAGSQDVRARIDLLPVQGTANPTTTLQIALSINGGAYSNVLTINSNSTTGATFAGQLTVNGDLVKGSFKAGGNNAYHSQQFLVGLADTNTQSYKQTNAGGTTLPKFLAWTSTSSTTAQGVILDVGNNNGIVLTNGNGSSQIARASINLANLTNTAGSEAGDLILSTQSGGTAYTQKMRISGLGNVVLGNEAALSTSATDGFTYIPTCAGTPTGVPSSYTGKVAMVYDTTNNKYYIYNGGWKSVTLT